MDVIKRGHRVINIGLMVGLLLSAFSPFASIAGATSPVDNVFSLTSQARVAGSNAGHTCASTPITTSWAGIITGDDGWAHTVYASGTSKQETQAAFNTALSNGTGWAVMERQFNSPGGVGIGSYGWAPGDTAVQVQFTADPTNKVVFDSYNGKNYAHMTADTSAKQFTVIFGQYYDSTLGKCTIGIAVVRYAPANAPFYTYINSTEGIIARDDNTGMIDNYKQLFVNSPITYPQGYAGVIVPDTDTWADLDGDGLVQSQEAAQGTSNFNKDTDGDGLNDYVESQWYPTRDAVFCGQQCAYPDPLKKDVYVEIDWMKNASGHVYKPTSAQLNLVNGMFADHDINFHADTGQYGGGNELSTYTQSLPGTKTTGQVDFWDYKDGGDGIGSNFSSNRASIWRYMIDGYNYPESASSSGWAETMGDDIFISGGLVEGVTGVADADRAMADTIAHEIGHSLCLTDHKAYEEQPSECEYAGIDNSNVFDIAHYNLPNYRSVMNYRYQLTDQDDLGVVDYSDGSHGTGDHDDWSAIAKGMGGFSGTHTLLGARANTSQRVSPDGMVIAEEAPISKIKENNQMQSSQVAAPEIKGKLESEEKPISNEMSKAPNGYRIPLYTTDQPFDWKFIIGGVSVVMAAATGIMWYIRRSN